MSGTNQVLPTREQIERRARQLHLQRGSHNGDELADWLAAEKELTQMLDTHDQPAKMQVPEPPAVLRPAFMLLDFYGFREQPFGMTPDPAYLFASRSHSDALASLTRGIADNRGFFALVAQPGMGKTTLLYQLLEDLRDSARTVLVSQTQCNSHEFIEYILHELGVDVKGMGLVAMHGKLNEILFEALLVGKRFVLVVDEAQNLDDSVLETVRMLSNFETHNAKLLQIVLAGQPRLASKLAQPKLAQLRQRVAVLGHLEPLSAQETGQYIAHRLKVAGYAGEALFDQAAIGALARQSDGIPRNINNLCYTALHLSHEKGQRAVTAEIVQQAARSLDMEALISEPPAIRERAPVAVPPAAPAKVAEPRVKLQAAPIAVSPIPSARPHLFLSYDSGRKNRTPNWPVRSAILAAVILSGILALAFLGRSQSIRSIAPGYFDRSSDALGAPISVDRVAASSLVNYDADPQDTGNGLVLTVAAGQQQSIKELCMRYLGHFDGNVSGQIRSLNPDLKDPDHLQAGQLIRIPLPTGAMRKVNDTAEGGPPAKLDGSSSGNFFARLNALLHVRK